MNESTTLIVGSVCAVVFWVTIMILVWTNPRNRTAWYIALGAFVCSPCLATFGVAVELTFVVAMWTIWATHGLDLSKPISAKTYYWTVATTSAFLIGGGIVGLLLFAS
jgi:hypothetical protein